jgi:hypothetical protein
LFVDSFSAREIRMNNDSLYALGVLGVLVGVISAKRFAGGLLEMLLTLTRPGATVLLLGLVAYLYSQGLVYTSLAAGVVSVYLLKDVWTHWVNSDERRLHIDVGLDQSRFNPNTSVDLQWANGTAVHDSPNMLHKDRDVSPLLLYPPSESTLRSMSG